MCFLDVVKEFDTKAYQAITEQGRKHSLNSYLKQVTLVTIKKQSTSHTNEITAYLRP